jgi:hypothetical protein
VFTPGRRQGPTTGPFGSQNPGLALPLPLTGAGPPPREAGPLGVRDRTGQPSVEWRRSPSQDPKWGIPTQGPSRDAPNTCRRRQRWDRLASQAERSTPGREPGRSLTPSPTKSGDFPRSFFGWSSPRGVAPTPRPGRSRAGVPNRLLAGFDALAGRARLLAERFVDRLALFAPRGPRFLSLWPREGGGSPRSVAGAVRCGRQDTDEKRRK